jgi:hypothetical protein
LNLDASIQQTNLLLHTGQTETFPLQCCVKVEALTQVANDKVNLAGIFPQQHFYPLHPAVLDV